MSNSEIQIKDYKGLILTVLPTVDINKNENKNEDMVAKPVITYFEHDFTKEEINDFCVALVLYPDVYKNYHNFIRY